MTLLRVRLRKPLIAASFLALAAASPALAQTWVDPPARVEAPSQPPSGASGQASVVLPTEPAAPPKAEAIRPVEPAPRPNVQAAQPSEPAPLRETDRPRQTAPSREAAAPRDISPASPPVAPASPEPKTAPAPQRTTKPTLTFSSPEAPPRARSVRRPRANPPSEPEVAARPQGRERQAGAAASAAQQLAIDYLGYWSAPNAVTLRATPEFYAPRVLFHGRVMSARALAEEKRRFIQRWPQRYYSPRLETMRTNCDPGREVCTVRTAFDFTALNPAQGARSRGTANLELGVSFAGGRPAIVFESSHIVRRGRSARSASLDNAE
jgi:hypothetical protein